MGTQTMESKEGAAVASESSSNSAKQSKGKRSKSTAKIVAHPDVLVMDQDEKFLIPTNRDRAYRIMIPDEPKDLDPKMKMPDTSTGRACRNLALLKEAEQQIKEDRLAAEKRVIRELKRERKTDFQLQVGRKVCQIAVNHQDPKDLVKVKFA